MIFKYIVPRNGRSILHVLKIGRISRATQDLNNIVASYAYAEKALEQIWTGEVVCKELGEQASGMLVERATINKAYELIEQGWPDVVLMEDLSRAYRNPRFMIAFIQDCVDAGVRVIAPGDGLDTADENWEVLLQTAALRHGLHIPDTRRRIRRTASDAFERGGMVTRIRFGWKKLTKEEADSGNFGPKGLRIAKVPEWTPIFQAMRRRILNGDSAVNLAEWLNSEMLSVAALKPGPYARQELFTPRIILSALRDPLCYGLRRFRTITYEYIYKSGKRRRSKNETPQLKLYPELGHMTQTEWEEMITVLDSRSAHDAQKKGAKNIRFHVKRSDSLTGFQHVRCAICGEIFYPVGLGKMKCKSALTKFPEDLCWNHVMVSQDRLREVMVDAVLHRIQAAPGAMEALFDAAWDQIVGARNGQSAAYATVDREILELNNQLKHVTDAIAIGGQLESLVNKLQALSAALNDARKRRDELNGETSDARFPVNRDEFVLNPRTALLELSKTSFAFANLMRQIIPRLVIQPVQTLDHGQVYPRLIMTLDLQCLDPGKTEDGASTAETIQIDLFEPPLHIKYLHAVVQARKELLDSGLKGSLDRLAKKLSLGRMTIKRALRYQRLIEKEGISDCYRTLDSKPAYASRWKPRSAKTSPSEAAIGGTI